MTEPAASLVLASSSAARAQLLAAAGLTFEVQAPGLDEATVKAALLAEGFSARDIADALAEGKAVKVSGRRPGLVIGSDQTLEIAGQLYDKADTVAEARARLLMMRGQTHHLHTAAVVAEGGAPIWRTLTTASLRMRPFSDQFLDGYLERNGSQVLSSVGCYHLEAEGIQLFDHIDGDYFSILGLPMIPLLDFLRRRNVASL